MSSAVSASSTASSTTNPFGIAALISPSIRTAASETRWMTARMADKAYFRINGASTAKAWTE
jgi:hypothetical protein